MPVAAPLKGSAKSDGMDRLFTWSLFSRKETAVVGLAGVLNGESELPLTWEPTCPSSLPTRRSTRLTLLSLISVKGRKNFPNAPGWVSLSHGENAEGVAPRLSG